MNKSIKMRNFEKNDFKGNLIGVTKQIDVLISSTFLARQIRIDGYFNHCILFYRHKQTPKIKKQFYALNHVDILIKT
jgi:hypothetical protein